MQLGVRTKGIDRYGWDMLGVCEYRIYVLHGVCDECLYTYHYTTLNTCLPTWPTYLLDSFLQIDRPKRPSNSISECKNQRSKRHHLQRSSDSSETRCSSEPIIEPTRQTRNAMEEKPTSNTHPKAYSPTPPSVSHPTPSTENTSHERSSPSSPPEHPDKAASLPPAPGSTANTPTTSSTPDECGGGGHRVLLPRPDVGVS